MKGLLALIEEARDQGFARANEEYYRRDINLGVAIRDASGRSIDAANVSLPTSRWSFKAGRKQVVPLLLETGRAISNASVR